MHKNNHQLSVFFYIFLFIVTFFIPIHSIAKEIEITEIEISDEIFKHKTSENDDALYYESTVIDKTITSFLKALTKQTFITITPKTLLDFLILDKELEIKSGLGKRLLATSIDDFALLKINSNNNTMGILKKCALDKTAYIPSDTDDLSKPSKLLEYLARCFVYTIQTQDNELCSFSDNSKEKRILLLIFLKDVIGLNYLTANGLAAINSDDDHYLYNMNDLTPSETENVRNCLYSSDLPDLYDCSKNSAIYYNPICDGQIEWRFNKILVGKAYEAYEAEHNTDGTIPVILLTSSLKKPVKSLFYKILLDSKTKETDPKRYYSTLGILTAQTIFLGITPQDMQKKFADTMLKKIGDDKALAFRYIFKTIDIIGEASALKLTNLASAYDAYNKNFEGYLKGYGGIMGYNINAKTKNETAALQKTINHPNRTNQDISQKIDKLETARIIASSEEKSSIWRMGRAIIIAPFVMQKHGRTTKIMCLFTIICVILEPINNFI